MLDSGMADEEKKQEEEENLEEDGACYEGECTLVGHSLSQPTSAKNFPLPSRANRKSFRDGAHVYVT